MKNSSFLNFTLIGMAINGLWLPKSLENNIWRIPFYVYAILYQLIMFVTLLFIQLIYMIQVRGDLQKMADVSALLLTYLAQLMKSVYIWSRQAKIKRLLETLDGPDFCPDDPSKRSILQSIGQKAQRVSRITIIASFSTAFMWGVIPMLKSKLALPLGYPDISTDSPWFKPLYVYETISLVLNAVGDAAEDFIAGGLMVLLSAQLQILGDELMTIGANEKLISVSAACSTDDDEYKKAVSCAKYHQSLIRFTEELNYIFGVPVACQFAASSLIICTTAFKITISRGPIELLTMTSYLICILVELLVFCLSGNFVMHRSQEVAVAAYSSGWVNTSAKTRRILLLIILRSQRPLSISAGKIFHLSLQTFTKILKTSYSFFAVLNQTH